MDCLELKEEACSREPENYKFTGSEEIDGDSYLFWYEADVVKSLTNSGQPNEDDIDVLVGSGMCKEPGDYFNNYYNNGIIFYNTKGKKYFGFSYPYICATHVEKIVHNLIINTKNLHHARHW